ncbi:DUF3105 domain-containing protein [uncultured Nocardioides sp.]|uniref:DUF3105 domain-containing protein n=1 Tax=uncultured Nocardioides sp. TaxID=198441 RepID=UPI00261C6350|nr:DUF3105 domain-containing protein [uncultured Nocardioides sp.]
MAEKMQKSDRRAVADKMRKQQKRGEKRRNFAIVGVCVLIALLIVGAAAFQPVSQWWNLRQYEDASVADIGAPADVCTDYETKPADGNQQHVPQGTPLTYPDSPPAFGRHWENWDGFDRKFYSASDRPELGMLVHNLEHGYTILWYDDTVADDAEQMEEIRALSEKFEGSEDLRNKFKAVPWTSEDGDPFPDGQHIAMTRWSAGNNPTAVEDGIIEEGAQTGIWQYCSEPSGAALDSFMTEFPYTDSPEPNAV